MAGSRMEKLSNIFKRYTGLIQTGAVLEESRPIWYDVYAAFPPTTDPTAVRKVSQAPIRKIFYEEDIARAKLNRPQRQTDKPK